MTSANTKRLVKIVEYVGDSQASFQAVTKAFTVIILNISHIYSGHTASITHHLLLSVKTVFTRTSFTAPHITTTLASLKIAHTLTALAGLVRGQVGGDGHAGDGDGECQGPGSP